MIVLGGTGRNFGAGMSGGTAYVYDPDGTFHTRLNSEMVDLDELERDDVEFLAEFVGKHYEETDSAVAARLLADWPSALRGFCKVMPKDYKSVLQAVREAKDRGEDVDVAVMAASRS